MEPPPEDKEVPRKLVEHGYVRAANYPRPPVEFHSEFPRPPTALSSSTSAMAPLPVARKVPVPVARKVPIEFAEHGDLRVDNYYWLRDDWLPYDWLSDSSLRSAWLPDDQLPDDWFRYDWEREYSLPRNAPDYELRRAWLDLRYEWLLRRGSSPCDASHHDASHRDVLTYLRDETDYTAYVMSDVKPLEKKIYAEIRGRVKKDDTNAPRRKGRYYYYERTLTGKEYVQHCRRHVQTDDPITVDDEMPTGPGAPKEHIILDENEKAKGHDYYRIGAFKVSPNNKLIAYAEDTKGDESYTVYVIDAESGQSVGQPLEGITSEIEWAGDDHLVYIIKDQGPQLFQQKFTKVSEILPVRPDTKLVSCAKDIEGDEIAKIGEYVGQPLKVPTCKSSRPGHDYQYRVPDQLLLRPSVTQNNTLRMHEVWLHEIGKKPSSGTRLYHETDEKFYLSCIKSESKRYTFVQSKSKNTSFVFYLDNENLAHAKKLLPLTPRVHGTGTTASHRGKHFFIMRRTDEFYNSELVTCPVDKVDEISILLRHRDSVKIQDFQLFDNHIAVYERENGLPKVTVYRLPPIGDPIEQLQGGQTIDFNQIIDDIDPIYAVDREESEFDSSILRFRYSSMRKPPSVCFYNMHSGAHKENKTDTGLGGFDASNYVTKREYAVAVDGTQIPMSILYRKSCVKELDGSNPVLLYGYGSYENCNDPKFCGSIFSLVDRGFIYVIAHIRGGGEMGRKWYEDGKLLKKKNTFTDFIACAEHLIENKYCSKEKLCIRGRSAGGLLMGVVLNMRPDLFKAAVVGVPFVDVLTTMFDRTIPLTTTEWEEWGDPSEKEYYDYMKSYSPVDNVKAQEYPNILVTAGLLDTLVMYSEPAKFVAKLRELKTNDNLLLFKCYFNAGHFQPTRLKQQQEDAFTYAFILKALA